MAITTRVQTSYKLRRLFAVVVCLVLGVWGVYDYAVKIPAQQKAWERGQVYRAVRDAVEAAAGSAADASEKVLAAREQLAEAVRPLAEAGRSPSSGEFDPALLKSELDARNETQWFGELVAMKNAVDIAVLRQQGQANESQLEALAKINDGLIKVRIDQTGNISRPSQFDRMTQWAFILCLPCVPWLAWGLVQAERQRFALEDDGSLHSPKGSWTSDQIADIDMSRWMSKSIATVVCTDGTRIVLDDYVHRDTHLIVGRLARRFHPDAWTAEAKPIKAGSEPADRVEGSDGSAAA